jgi:hypothetical protein
MNLEPFADFVTTAEAASQSLDSAKGDVAGFPFCERPGGSTQ